ncbi:MAG: site-specific DNA-methyltransferase [Alphaproteobacteria bacterium]|nr:site-specific DNA-methyltransferase [Alphaproteobacteria bacterium]MDA8030429.1 site-specific DNA-methyltransferase [Alphaproteobacteria bacterium]
MKTKNEFLMCGDALQQLQKLPDSCVDVGVTSPPYNKQENKKGWLVKNVKYDIASDKLPEDEYQQQQINVLNELFRVIKPGGSFFYNHKVRWERGVMLHPIMWLAKTDWTVRQEIVWDRCIAANIRGWRFWQVDERIYWLHKPKNGDRIGVELQSRHAKLTSVWRFIPEGKNPHPAPFPLVLPLRAIYSVMNEEKGVVIDPYCGSGTTLVAAKLLGHKCIGIDASREYLHMSYDRLKNFERERGVWLAECALHTVQESAAEKRKAGKYAGKFSPHAPAQRKQSRQKDLLRHSES